MYGLVNKAIEDLIRTQHGTEAWDQIRAAAGLDDDTFVSMKQYPDAVTYALVGAASGVLGLPAEQVLEAFGRYWITYTASEGYGELLTMGGKNVRQFLVNLDALHVRVGHSFENLRPPDFYCTNVSEASLVLHYVSPRDGLAHLVIGLLQGLGERFGQKLSIEHRERKSDGSDHDVFFVAYSQPTP
jgi:hypothetical protein